MKERMITMSDEKLNMIDEEFRSKVLKQKSYRDIQLEFGTAIDREKRTVEISFASEEPYERWWGIEIIDVPNMNIERLKQNGALLWNHDDTQHIGTVEKAEIHEDHRARAVVRFSKKAAAEEIWQDVLDGIVKHVSFGYVIEDFERVNETEIEGELNTYRVKANVFEVSFVHTPADLTVGIGKSVSDQDDNIDPVSTQGETNNNLTLEVSEMENEKNVETIDNTKVIEDAKASAKAEYKAYCDEVKDLCKLAGLAAKADELIDAEKSLTEVRKALWDTKAKLDAEKETRSIPSVEAGQTHDEKRKSEIEKGLLHAINSRNEAAESFQFESFEQLGRGLLSSNGVDSSLMGKSDIVGFLLGRTHSTSDWSDILANVAGKSLLDSYDAQMGQQTWRSLVEEVVVPDYKEQSVYRIGEAPSLLLKEEGAEYKAGTLSNSKEVYTIADYGRKIALTDRMLRNDDLSAFRGLARFGSAIARIENSLFWSEFLNGTVNGTPIFDASHNNIVTAANLDVASLGDGIEAMMKQEGLDQAEPLNIMPENVIVPVALMRRAQQYLSANFTADSSGNVNPYAGQMNLIADARLDKDSLTSWYMAASPAATEMFRLSYLSGQRAPIFGQMQDFDTDSIMFKVKHSCAVKVIDYRGLVKITP
jgi:hypothetical protein